MLVNSMFPSTHLKSEDIPVSGLPLVIQGISQGDVGGDKKWILHFQNLKSSLVLNKTNANVIAHLHGPDSDAWVGKHIVLIVKQVEFQGNVVPGIRVHVPPQQPLMAAAAPPPVGIAPDPHFIGITDDDIPF